ncbi:hypothetical protein VCBJG01_2410, partial [Vibrio cholerae BJG-01]
MPYTPLLLTSSP